MFSYAIDEYYFEMESIKKFFRKVVFGERRNDSVPPTTEQVPADLNVPSTSKMADTVVDEVVIKHDIGMLRDEVVELSETYGSQQNTLNLQMSYIKEAKLTLLNLKIEHNDIRWSDKYTSCCFPRSTSVYAHATNPLMNTSLCHNGSNTDEYTHLQRLHQSLNKSILDQSLQILRLREEYNSLRLDIRQIRVKYSGEPVGILKQTSTQGCPSVMKTHIRFNERVVMRNIPPRKPVYRKPVYQCEWIAGPYGGYLMNRMI